MSYILEVKELFLDSMGRWVINMGSQTILFISLISFLNLFISEDMLFLSDVMAKTWEREKQIQYNSEEV